MEPSQPETAVKTCRHCKQEIPIGARKCYHCSGYQGRLLSLLSYAPAVIAIIMMCISIVQVLLSSRQLDLSFRQLDEAKQQKKVASDALSRAQQAESSAQFTSNELKRLSGAMNLLYANAQARVDHLEDITEKANLAVADLKSVTDFTLTVEEAKNDSRKSFDVLLATTNLKNARFSRLASNALYQILVSTHTENLFMTDPQWNKHNVDPKKASFRVLATVYKTEHPYTQVRMQYTIWKQNRFSKRDRIAFLIDIIKTTSSVRCLHQACKLLDEEAGIGKNFTGYEEFLQWWDRQESCFKENDKPCQEVK